MVYTADRKLFSFQVLRTHALVGKRTVCFQGKTHGPCVFKARLCIFPTNFSTPFCSESSLSVFMKVVDIGYLPFAFGLTPFRHLQFKLWSKYYTWNNTDRVFFFSSFSYSFFLLFFNFFAPTSTKCSHFFVTCPKNKTKVFVVKQL
jgi:hypothetical protein